MLIIWIILHYELMHILLKLIFFICLVVALPHRGEESWHVTASFIRVRCLLIIPVCRVTVEWGMRSVFSYGLWRLLRLFDRFLLLSRFEIGVLRDVEGWCWSLMMFCWWEKFERSAILLLMVSRRSTLFDICFDRACGCWRDKCNSFRTMWHLLL